MQPSRSASAALAGATILGVLIAAILLLCGMQENGIERRIPPPRLLERRLGHDGLRLQAESSIIAGHADLGARLALASLRTGPLDRRALRALALARDAMGRSAEAARLMTLAGKLSWHDAATQSWLMRHSILNGDSGGGARHVDALLRGDPTDAIGLIGLDLLIQNDAGEDAVARRLALDPPWRGKALDALTVNTPIEAAGVASLYQAMQTTRSPPTPPETAALVDRLVEAGHGPIALAYWLSAGGMLPSGGELIDDPDFRNSAAALQRGEAGAPFGWTAPATDVAELAGDRDPAGRPALAIEDDGDGSGRFVYRSLVLPPGRYQLSYAASDGSGPSDAVRARLGCPHATVQPQAEPARSTRRATDLLVQVGFQLPAGCTALQLGFALAPSDAAQPRDLYLREVRLRAGG